VDLYTAPQPSPTEGQRGWIPTSAQPPREQTPSSAQQQRYPPRLASSTLLNATLSSLQHATPFQARSRHPSPALRPFANPSTFTLTAHRTNETRVADQEPWIPTSYQLPPPTDESGSELEEIRTSQILPAPNPPSSSLPQGPANDSQPGRIRRSTRTASLTAQLALRTTIGIEQPAQSDPSDSTYVEQA